MVYSFDIFDTCLVRKCGTPINFFDVLSWRVFREEPTESERQEFVCFRLESEGKVNCEGTSTLEKIYDNLRYENPKLWDRNTLYQIEIECEKEMLVPVESIKKEIEKLHNDGHKLVFISDMYLPSAFLRERLEHFGLFFEGDSIYVSGEIGKAKSSGELFQYVGQKENWQYKEWVHCGDNLDADIKVPKSLGIKTHKVIHDYTYYENIWRLSDYSLEYKAKSIAAGLSRSVRCSSESYSHSSFVADITAPLYSAWTYRIFRDANSKGIKRLYFCSRDGYQQYRIAQVIQKELFPEIECKYLYISRQALNQEDETSKLKYYIQEGLACHESVAIVDTRSQGRTQSVLNDLFTQNGYNKICAYYFEVFPCNEIKYSIDYVAEINKLYTSRNSNIHDMLRFDLEGPIYEIFFSMNATPRTVGYEIRDGESRPIFNPPGATEDFWSDDKEKLMEYYSKTLSDYIHGYIQTGLYRYSDLVFTNVAVKTLDDFLSNPRKEYSKALTTFYCKRNNINIPFVSDSGILQYFQSYGCNCYWREGTLAYFLSPRSYQVYKRINNNYYFSFIKSRFIALILKLKKIKWTTNIR